jgi:hypothetical protein
MCIYIIDYIYIYDISRLRVKHGSIHMNDREFSDIEKKNLPGRGLTKVKNHWSRHTGADKYVASTNPDRCL